MSNNRSRQERKTRNRNPEQSKPLTHFLMKYVRPMTKNQDIAFRAFDSGKHLLLSGCAGTGKTFISLYLGLKEVEKENYNQVVVVRSAVPTRDQGFLPGSLKEKAKVYEAPFMSACSDLYGRGDAYEILKQKHTVEFITTSYVRGITLNDAVVILDEAQNCTLHELSSIVTRIGKNCRIIVMGDFIQGDLQRHNDRKGLLDFIRIIKAMGSFELVEFGFDDILRSDVVKEYLVTQHNLGLG